MSNLLAALGRAQLTRLDAMIERRRAMRIRYQELFGDVPGVSVFGTPEDHEDNCWLTAILVDEKTAGWSTADLTSALTAENVESRPLWKPMHLQPVFAGARRRIDGTSQRLFETGLTLPSGSALSDRRRERALAVVRGFLWGERR